MTRHVTLPSMVLVNASCQETDVRPIDWTSCANAPAATAPARALYRLRVVYRETAAPRVEAQLRFDAVLHHLRMSEFAVCSLADSGLVQLWVHVLSDGGPNGVVRARRGLVSLVQRLGLEPQVRSVRWESVPLPMPADRPR